MPESPDKTQQTGPQDLHEVERALSVLGGRHPDHERARREDEENRRRRVEEQESVAKLESRRVTSRRAVIAAIGLSIVALFAFIAIYGRREMVRRAKIDAVSASFATYGFTPLETSLRGSTGAVEVTAEPGCLLAVSTADQPMTITRAGTSTTTAPPVLFCTCASERVGLSSPIGGQGGIALLRADVARIGGSRAFPFLPFPAASKITVDAPCAEASLDAWIDAKQLPTSTVTDEWLAAKEHRSLKDAGFHVVAHASGTMPFAVADLPAESCLIARTVIADDSVVLRAKGESAPLALGKGSVAHCRKAAGTLVASHLGTGDLFVMVAPAAKVGGFLGLRESATEAGISISTWSLAAADRGWDAQQALVASAIPPASVQPFTGVDIPPDPDARVVALSLEVGNELVTDLYESTQSACIPQEKTRHEEVCIYSGPQRWRTPPGIEGGAFGLARSKLPIWLFSMGPVNHPVAITNLAKLLRVARALVRQGFTPTTLEALIERPNGVEVLGRTGEDAVVAIGVAPVAPFVYPLSEDAPWDLDGAPQISLVKPLEKVTLVTTLKHLPPIALRRTVVFRRQAQVSP